MDDDTLPPLVVGDWDVPWHSGSKPSSVWQRQVLAMYLFFMFSLFLLVVEEKVGVVVVVVVIDRYILAHHQRLALGHEPGTHRCLGKNSDSMSKAIMIYTAPYTGQTAC